MAVKNTAQVVIGGKIITLGGYESEAVSYTHLDVYKRQTHVKLSPKEPDKIEYVLVNGAECEPYLTSDYRRMLEEPDKIVAGLEVMLKLFDHAKGYICIEDNKPDCIAKLRELVKGHSRIEVKEVMTKYPQGGERTLIYATTGREINLSLIHIW